MSTPPSEFAPWLGVFETLRVVGGKPLFVTAHLAELRRAVDALGLVLAFDPEEAREKLPQVSGRWRWIVTAEGTRTLFTPEEFTPSEPIAIVVSPVRVGSVNWDARFKTVSYLAHAQARKIAATPEVILGNEYGHVASAASSNIFWRRGDKIFTPAHEAGCRRGVVRGFVRSQISVEEGHFSVRDLFDVDEVFLHNSLRGIVSVGRLGDRPLAFPTADRLREAYDAEIARQLGS